MREKRKKRFEDFKHLFDTCEAIFKKLANSNESNKYFNDYYMLAICPGGRWGGLDKRIIEIFYGAKPFDVKETVDGNSELLKEVGVTLKYEQHDNGFVSVTYWPAKTDAFKVSEDSIMEDLIRNTHCLRKQRTIKKHFDNFVAYMEVTSLDGEPSLRQRFLVRKMRFFMFINMNSMYYEPKFEVWSQKLIRYVLTIGLSGFLLAVITYFKDNASGHEIEKVVRQIKQEQINTRKILEKMIPKSDIPKHK